MSDFDGYIELHRAVNDFRTEVGQIFKNTKLVTHEDSNLKIANSTVIAALSGGDLVVRIRDEGYDAGNAPREYWRTSQAARSLINGVVPIGRTGKCGIAEVAGASNTRYRSAVCRG